MSVINKMLRDLDSRQGPGTLPVQSRASRTGLASGTVIVNDLDRTGRRRVSRRFAVAMAASVMLLGGVLASWWYLNPSNSLQRKVGQTSLASAPATATPVTASLPAAAPVVIASSAPAMVETIDATLIKAVATPTMARKQIVPEPVGALADMSLKMDSSFKSVPSPAAPSRTGAADTARAAPERSPAERSPNERTVASPPTTPAATVGFAPPPPPQRRSPALEALAQAQSLWSAGSHEAGMELLREALAAAERENRGGTTSGNNSVLASLARELARMELADGRVSEALETLTRLEPALTGFADVWAMRGNAAQRLGRHEESAAAYLMALKLRPDEPRWMLGAAVSLAAQGKTASAAEWAEKARSGGVLRPEVASYLRQLGVPLREF